MKTRVLGKDLKVSAVSLGCMGMTHAFGAPSDVKEMTKLIHEAVDLGYIMFDTAECYTGTFADGTTAYNEELVGTALKPYRDKVVIATKFGVHHSPNGLVMDSHPDTIRKAVEGSLKRLDTDYIDLYYQHRIDLKIPVEEVAGVMSELIKEGKILHWGISETDEAYLRKAHAVCPVTAIQNRYSMMYRDYDALFPTLEELNIGYVAFSPLANGVLSDRYYKDSTFEAGTDYRSFMPQFKPEAYDENAELFEYIRALASDKDATPAQISLAWMICKHENLVPIPGTRKSERLKENGVAGDIILSDDEVSAIDKKLDTIRMSDVFGGSRAAK
ncbi:MAG: aldo/keto reductase [Oscillospiraceae bacterium]|nr:aldo/keto reductase [Oscillospiraceae bacterium]